VLTHGVALMLLGCMVAWSVLLIDELYIDGLFNAQIYYMCFVSFILLLEVI
jgi:hypothetical protein